MREFTHEAELRGAAVMTAIRGLSVTVCGAGALGANLVETLARQGFGTLRVIDHDRVEPQNVSTQPYCADDVGGRKGELLANHLFRAVGLDLAVVGKTLDADNAARLLRGSDLVVDCFDNHAARAAVAAGCAALGVPCLHAGLAAEYGEVRWDEVYVVPADAVGEVCDYPLARNLIMLTVAITAEVIMRWVASGARESFTVTLRDLAVRAW